MKQVTAMHWPASCFKDDPGHVVDNIMRNTKQVTLIDYLSAIEINCFGK